VRLAGNARLRRVPLISEEADQCLGDLSREQRLSRAWLIAPDGRRWGGAEAIWHALYLVPLLGLLLRPLRWLPGFHSISEQVYWWVASHRGSAACRLDQPTRGETEADARRRG
jgi:predicted DCC family thiol-disulfide oxidoreductase YuxK